MNGGPQCAKVVSNRISKDSKYRTSKDSKSRATRPKGGTPRGYSEGWFNVDTMSEKSYYNPVETACSII